MDKERVYCLICGKSFASVRSRNRHRRAQHTDKTYSCPTCLDEFDYSHSRDRHAKKCAKESNKENNTEATLIPRPHVRKRPASPEQNNRTIKILKDGRIRLSEMISSNGTGAKPLSSSDPLPSTSGNNCSSNNVTRLNDQSKSTASRGKPACSTTGEDNIRSSNNPPPPMLNVPPTIPPCNPPAINQFHDSRQRSHPEVTLEDLVLNMSASAWDEIDLDFLNDSAASISPLIDDSFNFEFDDQLGGAEIDRDPWVQEDGTIDEPLHDLYIQHANTIYRSHQLESPILHEFNFHLQNGTVTMDDIISQLEYIYQNEDSAFRVNMSLGFVLSNRETGELRYWYAHNNESVFSDNGLPGEEPVPMIGTRADLDALIERLRRIDFHTNAWQHRDDTKSLLYRITNTRWVVTKVDAPLGAPVILPNYLKNKRSIVGLTYDQALHRPYQDNLCLFRCLAFHQAPGGSTKREIQWKLCHLNIDPLVKRWQDHMDKSRIGAVQKAELPLFEALFEININVYELDSEGGATMFYKSMGRHNDTMYLNHFDGHLSYIKNLATYSGSFQCRNCGTFFKKTCNLDQHERRCNEATQLKFPGGFYSPPKSLHEELISFGFMEANEPRKFYKFVSTFDMESILKKVHIKSDTGKLVWTAEHQAISVSLCSNIPEFNSPKCFVDPDLDSLMKQMLDYLHAMQKRASSEMEVEFSGILQRLENDIAAMESRLNQDKSSKRSIRRDHDCDIDDQSDDDDAMDDFSGDQARETDENEPVSEEMLRALKKPNTARQFFANIERIGEESHENPDDYNSDNTDENNDGNDDDTESILSIESQGSIISENDSNTEVDCDVPSSPIPHNSQESESKSSLLVVKQTLLIYKRLLKKVKEHVNQLPVLGFNSQKYDINLARGKLLKHIVELEGDSSAVFIVKKGSSYSNISTPRLKFLDASNFCSPGVSYDKFLKAYGSKVSKSYFPYEWFDDPLKLQHRTLPSYDQFHSSLKGYNTLESDYIEYEKLLSQGLSPDDALKLLRISCIPKTGAENYAELEDIWKRNGMETFEDFLRFYNNRDVEPFVGALVEMVKFYRERDIDLFRETQSVPGVARLLLMRSKEPGCHFSLFKPAHQDIYRKIRNNIVGGPSIIFNRHHKAGETRIRGGPKICAKIVGYDANALYLWALSQPLPTGPYTVRKVENGFKKEKSERYLKEWYWLEWMAHNEQLNIQHKFNMGQKRVGPFLLDGVCGKRAFEFNGCYFHGHNCWMNKDLTAKQREIADTKFEQCQQRKRFIEQQGYEVTEIFECQFHAQLKSNPDMQAFMEKNFDRPCDKKPTMTKEEIIEAVMNDSLFGAVEVDISVPDNLYDHFKEMSPIFCTSEVKFEDFGEHMKEFVKARGLSQKPRKLLIGGMKAKNILLASNLLKWYINHGLEVTAVHCVIEYDGKSCFEQFVKDITEARLLGDLDPSQACRGDTCKLIGNSAYGSVIMDKLKHLFTCIVQGLAKAQKKVNLRRFRKLEELDDFTYELQLAKQRICLNMPHQVGFFILQHAKLRMLEFYYDFLDKYVDRSSYEVTEMDTDSLYFALSEETLEKAVKPELVDEFNAEKHLWLPRTDTKEHQRVDRRRSGIFKLEAIGTEMTSLCSKTYCLYDAATDSCKFSSKGLNKKQFESPLEIYNRVLESGKPESGENVGFRMNDNHMHTYHQQRLGFSNFYCKRIVNSDGVSTRPLDITLIPPQ